MLFRLMTFFLFLLVFSACSEKGGSQPMGMGTTEEENGLAVNPGSSSSIIPEDKYSSGMVVNISSSSQGTGISSAVADSNYTPFDPPNFGGLISQSMYWDGSDTEGRVEAGSQEETAGYWYTFSDQDIAGESKLVFPSDVEENSYGNFFGPIAEAYGGIKAKVVIDETIEEGYAGIGFNVWSESLEGGDVSRWGGICLTYTSTVPFKLVLVSADTSKKQFVEVPLSTEMNEVSFGWEAFKFVSATDGSAEDGDIFRRNVAVVWLQFQESGEFLLTKIASLKSCE